MNYLLDTCVLSELVAPRPNPTVLMWIEETEEDRLYLSTITIGETQRGIARLPDSARRTLLEKWLEQEMLPRFSSRVMALDAAVMLTWGQMVAKLEKSGRTLPAMDSLIAALAYHHTLQLVTRNERDFDGTGLTIVNPWR